MNMLEEIIADVKTTVDQSMAAETDSQSASRLQFPVSCGSLMVWCFVGHPWNEWIPAEAKDIHRLGNRTAC